MKRNLCRSEDKRNPTEAIGTGRGIERGILVTTIGSAPPSLRYSDRAEYIRQTVERSNGNFTIEGLTKALDQADQAQLRGAEAIDALNRGDAVYLGSVKAGGISFYDPAEANGPSIPIHAKYNVASDGRPAAINALNVDFVVADQDKLFGHTIKNISYYADYLQGEVQAAADQQANVTFTGYWGKNVTNDVNEYVNWLYEAAYRGK